MTAYNAMLNIASTAVAVTDVGEETTTEPSSIHITIMITRVISQALINMLMTL